MGYFLARHKQARAVSPRALIGRCFVGRAVAIIICSLVLFGIQIPVKKCGVGSSAVLSWGL